MISAAPNIVPMDYMNRPLLFYNDIYMAYCIQNDSRGCSVISIDDEQIRIHSLTFIPNFFALLSNSC